jgi:hypothetical protein
VEQAIPNKSSEKRIAYKVIVIVGLNGILALLAQIEPFLATMIVLGLFIWVAIPATILAVIWPLILKGRPMWVLRIGRGCRLIATWIFLLLPVCPIAMVIADYRMEATKRHCENLIPRLDEWRQQNGHYPTTLIEIGESNPHHWLIEYYYGSSENSFHFQISDPSAFFGLWIYDSGEHRWIEED